MKKYLFSTALVVFGVLTNFAQVGIGTTSPNANAALDVTSTSQGMLFPRMTSTQRDAISNPAKGLTIYNTTLNSIQTNTGTSGTPNWKAWNGIHPSTNGTAVVTWTDCSTASAGTLAAGVAVSGVTQTITANVTTAGTYNITTNTTNGVTFSGSGTFTSTGSQTIVLNASGTPTVAGSTTFTLNTTPNCSFSRITITPLPANITLSAISPYFVASVYDQDYLPYTAPTVAASLATAQAANGTNETITLNIQGELTTSGVTIKIPYTVSTGSVSLPAFSQTINVPASYTEDGVARDVIFSYGTAASLAVGNGTINATLKSVDGTLNVKRLDLQTGIGNDNLGWLLAQFIYATNNSGGTANLQFRSIAAIPDRNIANANHVMLYMPVLGADGKTWLNNNLGADYANTSKANFNPASQATAFNDWKAYGSLFQWGRYSDGHELITRTSSTAGTSVNGTTATRSSTNTPANSSFITINSNPNDWRNPQNNALWQGESGTNNPCPIGYRLPTDNEFTSLVNAASITNYTTAASSTLKFSAPGWRSNVNGVLNEIGNWGMYWTSTVSTTNGGVWISLSNSTVVSSRLRAYGFSVRCIKD